MATRSRMSTIALPASTSATRTRACRTAARSSPRRGISRARRKGARVTTVLGVCACGRRTLPSSRAVSASRKSKRISIPHLGYINRRNIRDYTGELGYTYRPLESGSALPVYGRERPAHRVSRRRLAKRGGAAARRAREPDDRQADVQTIRTTRRVSASPSRSSPKSSSRRATIRSLRPEWASARARIDAS